MLSNVFTKTLRDQRWALLGWGIGVFMLVLVESWVWPTVRDMPNFDEFAEAYPEPMRELFDLGAMTTASGFLNAELFTLVLPMLFIIFSVGRGARMVAGEEAAGTLEVVLVTRVSPIGLVLHKAAALLACNLVLGMVLFTTLTVTSSAFDMDVGTSDIAAGSLAMVLLGAQFGFLAVAIGAATGRRALALGVAGTAALASYLLYALGKIVESLESWRLLSPFDQALSEGPLGAPLPWSIGWVVLVPLLCLAISLPLFDRRDLRTH